MKRKIFPVIAAVMLTAASVIPTSAATINRRPCRPTAHNCGIICHFWCPNEEQKPSVPETPDTEQTPSVPETEQKPSVPETPDTEQKPSVPEADTSAMSKLEQEASELVNEHRTENGLKPLTISSDLSVKARIKSTDMLENNYFNHISPTYGSPFDLMKSLGITYRTAGENIAMGYKTAEAVVNAWMNSPSHRANILSSNYTSMGIGHVNGYWTQWFIG